MKIRNLWTIATIAFVASSCNATSEDDALVNVFPETTVVQALHNGEALEFIVTADEDATAPFTVTVESLDSGRASASFDDGSSQKTYNPSSDEPLTVFVTCQDDKGLDSDIVTILFTAESSLDDVDDDFVVREIVCPGTNDTNDPNPTPDPNPNPDPDPNPNPNPNPGTDDNPSSQALVRVTPTTGLFTAEDGTTATFTVVLGQQPKSDVAISATSDDSSEGVVTPSSVTFTTSNWNTPQTFTITGQDDDLSDGDINYHIHLGPTQSSDPAYKNVAIPSLDVVNRDNDRYKDPAGIAISPKNLTVYEGGTAKLSTVLDVKPSSPVTLTFTASDASRATVEPSSITFNPSQYATQQSVAVIAKRNGTAGDTADIDIQIKIASTDPRFNGLETSAFHVHIVDTEGGNGETVSFRAMAANISTGNNQSYDPGHGIRIFKAVKPDIVMIQEFRYGRNNDDDINSMVSSTFGPEYFYSRGRYVDSSWIPNGIISRFPIIESGYWKSNLANNRDWDWAILDLPGNKELLVVSLHLLTEKNAQEIGPLTREIENKIADDKKKNLEYYVMVGGDFNSSTVLNGKTDLKRVVYTSFSNNGSRPKDQDGDTTTNATRGKTLDVLLVDKELQQKEIPAKIGRHSYNNGHVFDSRVYDKLGELGDVTPVQADDCKGGKPIYNQHMAVIRDFEFTAQ